MFYTMNIEHDDLCRENSACDGIMKRRPSTFVPFQHRLRYVENKPANDVLSDVKKLVSLLVAQCKDPINCESVGQNHQPFLIPRLLSRRNQKSKRNPEDETLMKKFIKYQHQCKDGRKCASTDTNKFAKFLPFLHGKQDRNTRNYQKKPQREREKKDDSLNMMKTYPSKAGEINKQINDFIQDAATNVIEETLNSYRIFSKNY